MDYAPAAAILWDRFGGDMSTGSEINVPDLSGAPVPTEGAKYYIAVGGLFPETAR